MFQDQLQVWEKVHSGYKSCVVCGGCAQSRKVEREEESEGGQKRDGEKKRITCPSNVLPKRSLELTMRLEEDALKVRESVGVLYSKPRSTEFSANSARQVVTLLNLLQGQASTENALKASEQSKILAVFTVVTVVFVSPGHDCLCIQTPKS